MKRALIHMMVAATAWAGSSVVAASDTPSAKRIAVFDDIVYRSGPSRSWRLDLAMPENFGPEKRAAIVIVHGGGWNAGTKRDRPYRSMLLDYALKGYVTVSVEYRLRDEAPLPACIEDVKCAVRWLKAHAKEYRIDPKRIGVYGHSAGAHLALMLGLCGPDAGLEGDGGWNEYSSSVTAVAGGSPPTFMPERFGDPEKHSPSTYISADALPILLIQGTADRIVPVATTDDFVAKLKQVGAKDVTYVRIEGGNHGVAYDSYLDRSTAALDEFFERTLKKTD
jgi:acetyl esterase/lipase